MTSVLRREGALVLVRVVGSHFLWKMVRRIVGVVVEVGRGGLAVEQVGGLLSSTSDLPPKLTAPSSGLFLERVLYPGDSGITSLCPPSFAFLIPPRQAAEHGKPVGVELTAAAPNPSRATYFAPSYPFSPNFSIR